MNVKLEKFAKLYDKAFDDVTENDAVTIGKAILSDLGKLFSDEQK